MLMFVEQTYMLTLPFPIAKYMPRVAACLVKYVHKMQYKECVFPSPSLQRIFC